MDSPSSPSLTSATPEDDGALSLAAGLAKEAALLFQSGKYADCLRVLNHLLTKKRDDPKIRHNIAIAESFRDGCLDPKLLIEALENVKKKSEELARADGDKDLASGGSKSTSGSNNAVNQFPVSPVVYNDDFDSSVPTFNLAVSWFYLHEYEKSYLYLDTLFQNIEPIDEGTALRICVLLLDVSLRCHHALKFADVIGYVEKVFCGNSLTNQLDNGTTAHQQASFLPKSTSLTSNPTLPESSQSDSVNAHNLESSLTRTLSEEVLEDESLQLLSSLDITGKSLQKAGIASSIDIQRSQADESLSGLDIKLNLHLYKVRFFILTRNLKAAKREVKMAMNLARGKDYPLALYLKSQLEYARGNHRKAIKLLMASSSLPEAGISSMYYNNLGSIYYRLGKHHTAGIFFTKALKSVLLMRKEKPKKFLSLSQDKSLLISYNCGVHSLACGKPLQAARCFQKASLIFYNRPILWLRIAECCLMAIEKGMTNHHLPDSDVGIDVIGTGKWRQLALRSGTSPYNQAENVTDHGLYASGDKQPVLSLSLARQCLVNALFLLNSDEKHNTSGAARSFMEGESQKTKLSLITNDDSASTQISSTNGEVKEQKGGGNNQSGSLHSSVSGYELIRKMENQTIMQAILADLAYVELALGNPLMALSTAKSLLKLPECSRMYIFFGTLYAAEALCLLNRPNEAAQLLMTYVSSGNNVELPYHREDFEKLTFENKVVDNEDSTITLSQDASVAFTSPEEARGMFCANYAANFALLGDLKQAEHFVNKALSDIPNNSQAILTSIYVDLKNGKTQEALAKLKQHSAIRFDASARRFTSNLSS